MNLKPIIHFDENTGAIYTNYGAVMFGFKVELPELFSLPEDQIVEIQETFAQFIGQLPNDTVFTKFDAFVNSPIDTDQLPDSTFFEKYTKKYFEGEKHLVHHSYMFIALPKVKSLSSSLNNPLQDIPLKDVFDEQKYINHHFTQEINNAIALLTTKKKIGVTKMTRIEVERLNYDYFNLFNPDYSTTMSFSNGVKITPSASKSFNPKDLTRLSARSSVSVGANIICGYLIRNEKQLPNDLMATTSDRTVSTGPVKLKTALGDHFGLLLRCPHYLTTTIIKDDIQKWISKIKSRAGTFERLKDLGGNLKTTFENLSKLQNELSGDYNQRLIVRASTSLLFWDDKPEALDKKVSDFSGLFKGVDIIPTYPTSKHLKQIWVTSNPLFSPANSEMNFYPNFIDVPVCFLPVFTNYRSDEQGLILCDRFNTPIKVDLWDEQKKNINARNFIVVAPTGEGKSFLLQELVRQYIEQGVNIVLIELGRSFHKFSELLGDDAAYIQYNEGQAFGIDVFNSTHEELLTTEKLNSIAEFVLVHIQSPTEPLKDIVLAQQFLRKLVEFYIKTKQVNLTFPDFILFIIENEDAIKLRFSEELQYFDFLKMRLLLSDFIGDGAYAFLYKGNFQSLSNSLDNKKFVGFELHNAEKDKRLLDILLQNISETIERNVWRDKTKKGIVLFEEFARTLKLGNTFDRVQYIAQAVRKQGGALGLVLQTTEQLPKSTEANSILENIQLVFTLYNSKGYSHVVDRIKFEGNHTADQMGSMQNNFSKEKRYSNVFIKRGNEEHVYNCSLHPAIRLAYITDGADEINLRQRMADGISVKEAIESMLPK